MRLESFVAFKEKLKDKHRKFVRVRLIYLVKNKRFYSWTTTN
jgi:hypothetical protein